jgi:hypothetical protein
MARKGKIVNKGAYLVNEKHRGALTHNSTSVVMDNTVSHIPAHNKKLKVSYFITENAKLLAGQNTVAIFNIKKRQALQPGALF